MTNPYSGKDFFSFFLLLFRRCGEALIGQSHGGIATDEIQILALSFLAISSALIGTFLILKKMTMLANSLSHTVLMGVVIAYLILLPFCPAAEIQTHAMSIRILFFAALFTAFLTTLLTHLLNRFFYVQEDASIGLVFTTLFSIGLILITVFTRNTHLGIEAVMGNIDALHGDDLYLLCLVGVMNLIVICVGYKAFKVVVFDAAFAQSQGYSPAICNYLLLFLTSATVIAAFRVVGVLLVLAFLVGPALTARLVTHRLKALLVVGTLIGIGTALISVALARHLLSVYQMNVSTAGLAVTLLGGVYFLTICYKQVAKKLEKVVP